MNAVVKESLVETFSRLSREMSERGEAEAAELLLRESIRLHQEQARKQRVNESVEAMRRLWEPKREPQGYFRRETDEEYFGVVGQFRRSGEL